MEQSDAKGTPPAMRRGPYRKGVQRRHEVVEAAAQVFGELGYNGGSLRNISERVGVSSASLIQYFGTKEGLLTAVLEWWADKSYRTAAADLRGLAWIDHFRVAMRYNVEHRGLVELLLSLASEASSEDHPARMFFHDRYRSIVANMGRHLWEAVDDGEIRPLSDAAIERECRVFYAVMDGLQLQWLLDSSVDLVATFDEYLDHTVARWRDG